MFDSPHIASVHPFVEALQAAVKPYFYTMRFLRGDTIKKKLEDTNRIIRSRKSNGRNDNTDNTIAKRKKTNNDLQIITQKTKPKVNSVAPEG